MALLSKIRCPCEGCCILHYVQIEDDQAFDHNPSRMQTTDSERRMDSGSNPSLWGLAQLNPEQAELVLAAALKAAERLLSGGKPRNEFTVDELAAEIARRVARRFTATMTGDDLVRLAYHAGRWVILDKLRSESARHAREREVSLDRIAGSPASDAVDSEALERLFARVFERLSPSEESLLQAVHLDRRSISEIARACNASRSTVHRRVADLYRRLQDLLLDEAANDVDARELLQRAGVL